jgi:hypothetical protein
MAAAPLRNGCCNWLKPTSCCWTSGARAPSRAPPAQTAEIIDDRAGSNATIVTARLHIEQWHAWIGDATIADAILDRVMQHHYRFTLTGESIRQVGRRPAPEGESQ